MLIYSHQLSSRLTYIFKTIFADVLQIPVSFTDNIEQFKKTSTPKINYSNTPIDTGLFFESSSILFEEEIKKENITIIEYKGNKCFFPVGEKSELPFDPFAASFYLITRYEEYLPHRRDQHDRFVAAESLAFQHDFLEIPLVNIWIEEIVSILKVAYENLKIPHRKFNYLSTIDIDNAYAYKHKGIIRTLGGLAKSLIKNKDIKARIRVLMNKQKDPYDTFDYQLTIHEKYGIDPIYFFLLGDYGKHDKNISVKNATFRSLIKSIAKNYNAGIHPSYSSNKDVNILIKEIDRLKNIINQKVDKSRQHFLKLNLPYTYRRLLDNNIKEDYTMGYAEIPGFRASICSPYYFFDLSTNSETELKIVPFAVMEASFQYYNNIPINDIVKQIIKIMNNVKKVDGCFVSIWHNESFSDGGIWKGWKTVYEKMLAYATNENC